MLRDITDDWYIRQILIRKLMLTLRSTVLKPKYSNPYENRKILFRNHWWIQRGARNVGNPPPGPYSFFLMQFSATALQHNRLAHTLGSWCPLWEILDPQSVKSKIFTDYKSVKVYIRKVKDKTFVAQ